MRLEQALRTWGSGRGRVRTGRSAVVASTSRAVRTPTDPVGFLMEVVTTSGRAAAVEFRISRGRVEVWYRRRRTGVVNRDLLEAWLAAPGRPLLAGKVAFSLDRMVDADGRVALTLPDVEAWTLAPAALAQLRKWVGPRDPRSLASPQRR
jgi:hypothetical protein